MHDLPGALGQAKGCQRTSLTRRPSNESQIAIMIARFDDIDSWAPSLTEALNPYVSQAVKAAIAAAAPAYVEDALDLLLELTRTDDVTDATMSWLRRGAIAGYHGTRLTDQEVASVRAHGLTPLEAGQRRSRLVRALAPHPRWNEVSPRLDQEIAAYGREAAGGNRENQVHLTLSMAGLTDGFNHYITHGSEFDQCVANALLGSEGVELLRLDGEPRLIEIAVPGDLALLAAHPYFSIEDKRSRGELPNIVTEFLQAWSFRQSRSNYQCRTMGLDCGMIFRSTVSRDWITRIDTLPDFALSDETL